MKAAFLIIIFVIVGGVAILLALPAEDQRAALEFRQARAELALPPQTEDDVAVTKRDLAVIPEPVDQYSSVQIKRKIRTTTSRHRHVARRHLNFLEKLVVSFIKLQKHQPTKRATKQSRTNLTARLSIGNQIGATMIIATTESVLLCAQMKS